MSEALTENETITTGTMPSHLRPVPDGDPKRKKFEKLASARVKRAIKAIRIVAGMGGKNRYAYSFSSADVDKIAQALDEEVTTLREKMIAPGRQMDIEFDFK